MTLQAMTADLKRSGINGKHTKLLKLKVLTAKQTEALTGFETVAYKIPYFGVDGKPLEYWRVRYLEEVRGKFNAKLKKSPRYSQPRDTIPHLYFPPVINWSKLAADTTEPLVITEGEKKATKACIEGVPCIGLGGVWAWKSKKHNLTIIPDFKSLKWENRNVYLCFDNDLNTNPMVVDALNALAKALLKLGAKVFIKYLPDDGEKIGLDDYLITHSAEDFLRDLETEEFAESKSLWALNTRIAVIESKNAIYDLETAFMYPSAASLTGVKFGRETYEVPKADGGMKTVNAAAEWLKWRHRRGHSDLSYAPGKLQILEDGALNTWKGWGCEQEKGTIKPFVDLINYVFDGDDDLKKWFYKWLAYPLQNPGAKMFSAVAFYSPYQGVGKSFIGLIMGDIYGPNFVSIGQEQLHSSFNAWAANKQFILGEEITGSDKRQDSDNIKNMLTRETIYVNIKYQSEYELPDCANYLFTTNHNDALFLEKHDRRIAVHEIKGKPREREFYKVIDAWRKAGGAAALFEYLLAYDCGDFDPYDAAPVTSAKIDMIELSRSDLDSRCYELLEAPASVLVASGKPVERELYTIAQLLPFLYDNDLKYPSSIAVSKALVRAGFERRSIQTTLGVKKLWALTNRVYWSKKPNSVWTTYFDKLEAVRAKFKA